jgi:hypothetical protein
MTVLADHNLEGQAVLLWGTLAAEGWLALPPLRLVMFHEVGCPQIALIGMSGATHKRTRWFS